jgi:hypothetical protein
MPATEDDVAFATLIIAAEQLDGIATFDQLREQIPDHLSLDSHDLAQSDTRPNEPMWHQIIRNIQSHHPSPGNFIHDGYLQHVPSVGYQITPMGKKRLERGR